MDNKRTAVADAVAEALATSANGQMIILSDTGDPLACFALL